jgi:AcrR family transcriptional regulator
MATSKARERILATATRLFYEEGIQATGVDRVIAEAEVAPMTLYRHFGGKDTLVTATLERWSADWLAWLRREVQQSGDQPGAPLEALWDALEKWFAAEGFRGSYIASAATELRSKPDHPAHRTIAAHRTAVRALLHDTALASGAPHPDAVALQLHMLIDGAMSAAVVDRQPAAAATARTMATRLIPATRRSGR